MFYPIGIVSNGAHYPLLRRFKMKTNNTAIKKIKEIIKNEAWFHDQWDEYNLMECIAHSTKEEADKLIDEFNHYDLPSSAEIGKSWNLPDWFIQGNNSPEAPYWSFAFCEFTAYIKAVKPTDDPDTVEVEYYVYRQNNAHCNGYYGLWDTGKAMVDISTHRRWNVA